MPKNKDFEVKRNFYAAHLDRQVGSRGRKPGRLSLKEDLIKLGRALHIPVFIDR
jgi:hypothetical protein